MYIISFLSILGWIFFLSIKYKKYAPVFPLIVCTTIVSLLYLSAFLGILLSINRLLIILGLLLPLYCWLKLKITWKDIKDLPLSYYLFLFLGLIWFIFTLHASIFGGDEFFWGQFTKVLVQTNHLYHLGSPIFESKVNYPPGTSLFQYFFLNFGFSEAGMYFAQGILIFAAISPFFALLEKKIWPIVLGLLIIFSLLAYFGPGILALTNDHILGALFGGGLLVSFIYLKSPKEKLFLLPIIYCLPQIKTTGVILAAVLVIAAALDLLVSNYTPKTELKQKNLLRSTMIFIVLIMSVIISFKSWDYYLARQNISAAIIPSYSSIEQAFSSSANGTQKTIIKNFFSAIVTLPINLQEGGYGADLLPLKLYLHCIEKINHLGLSIASWTAIILVLWGLVIYLNPSQERKRLLVLFISILIGLIIYLLFHLFAYLFYFSTYEATNLASMNRYIGSYLLAMTMVTSGLIYLLFRDNPKKRKAIKIFGVVVLGYLLIFHTPPLVSIITPPAIRAQSTDKVRAKTLSASQEINNRTERQSKIFVIYQNSNGWECMMIRYDIVPRKMEGGNGTWSLGERYGPNDVWTQNLTPEEWSQQLLEGGYNYVYLARVDNNFWSHYSLLFSNPEQAKGNRLFVIEHNNNQVLLSVK